MLGNFFLVPSILEDSKKLCGHDDVSTTFVLKGKGLVHANNEHSQRWSKQMAEKALLVGWCVSSVSGMCGNGTS